MLLGHSFKANLEPRIHANYKSHRSIRSCSKIRGFPFNFLLICFWGIRLKLISHPEYMQITNLIALSGHVAKFRDFLKNSVYLLLGNCFKANLAHRIHANYKSHLLVRSCSRIPGFPENFLFICFWGIRLKLISHPEYMQITNLIIESGHVG